MSVLYVHMQRMKKKIGNEIVRGETSRKSKTHNRK